MSEAQFWQEIRKNCTTISFYRVENSCDPGMPDVHFITPKGAAGWAELKYIPKSTHKVKMQSGQPKWLFEYSKSGGCALILVRVGSELIYAFDGSLARKLNQGIHVDKITSIFRTEGGRPSWKELEDAIIAHSLEAYHCVVERHSHKQQ